MRRLILYLAVVLLAWPCAFADEYDDCTEAWVLCQPDSWVHSRLSPKKTGRINAYLFPGQRIYLDGKRKNGFVHYVGTHSEDGEGWVSKVYVVYDQPVEDGHEYLIRSTGRVACRRYINGTRRCWIYDGDPVIVHWKSAEWCVTNKGFIRTEFIDLDTRQDIENNMDPDDMTWEDD